MERHLLISERERERLKRGELAQLETKDETLWAAKKCAQFWHNELASGEISPLSIQYRGSCSLAELVAGSRKQQTADSEQ